MNPSIFPGSPPNPWDQNQGNQQDQDYIKSVIQQLLQSDPQRLRGMTIDTTMSTPQSVARNYGIGMDQNGNYANPGAVAGIYQAMNQPPQPEYAPPTAAQYPAANLQAASALQGIQGSQQQLGQQAQMAPLQLQEAQAKLAQQQAQTQLTQSQARYQEALANFPPAKAQALHYALGTWDRNEQNLTKLATAASSPQQAMAFLLNNGENVTSPEQAKSLIDQQYKNALANRQRIAQSVKKIAPDIDLTSGEEPTTTTQMPGGGGAGAVTKTGIDRRTGKPVTLMLQNGQWVPVNG
jgi:hypothetical protein